MSYEYPKRKGNKINTFLGQNEFFKHFTMRCKTAEHEIWCGISFVHWNFVLPNGQKWWELFIDLKMKTPDLNIRCLFWRNTAKYWSKNELINGDENDLAFIKKYDLHKYIQFKWDESPNIPHCHHGKYYIIDNKYALIGGMTLNGHKWFDYIHDTFMEINGASTIDVTNNFKLRWNHNNIFSEEPAALKICHPETAKIDTDSEQNEDAENKEEGIECKIVWSCSKKLYPEIGENGISSVHDEYCKQFKNAQSSIYIESQHMGEYKLLSLMKEKLESDDEFFIFYLVPIWMKSAILKEKNKSIEYETNPSKFDGKPRYYDTFKALSELNEYKNFCLSGVYHDFNKDEDTENQSFLSKAINGICNQFPQYIHSKLCIVDGKWFTIGSANMVDISFISDHTEINGCVYNENESMKLLKQLAMKHCDLDQDEMIFSEMNDKEIVKYMIDSARTQNHGLYELNAALYGTAKHSGFIYKMISSFI